MKHFKTNFSTFLKKDYSPVTEADLAANSIIINELTKHNIPIISEEIKNESFVDRRLYEEYWLIDPLDGTKQFVSGENEFTVNIARIKKNKAIEGVIYLPVDKTLYYGHLKLGAYKFNFENKKTVRLPYKNTSKLTVVASKSHMNKETENFLDKIKEKIPETDILHTGSSIKICKIAEGSANLYPRLGSIKEWDIAAGHAILKAAGGNIYNLNDFTEITYNLNADLKTPNFIACIYSKEELLNLIKMF